MQETIGLTGDDTLPGGPKAGQALLRRPMFLQNKTALCLLSYPPQRIRRFQHAAPYGKLARVWTGRRYPVPTPTYRPRRNSPRRDP